MTISHVDHEPSYSSYPVLCGIFHYFKTISYTQARPLSQVKLFHNIADNYATFTGKLRWRKIFKAQDNKERYTLHGMVGREIVQVETGMSDWYPLSTGTIALSKPALKEWYLSESDDLPGARRKGSIIVNNFC